MRAPPDLSGLERGGNAVVLEVATAAHRPVGSPMAWTADVCPDDLS